jgi:hypothetical protein
MGLVKTMGGSAERPGNKSNSTITALSLDSPISEDTVTNQTTRLT